MRGRSKKLQTHLGEKPRAALSHRIGEDLIEIFSQPAGPTCEVWANPVHLSLPGAAPASRWTRAASGWTGTSTAGTRRAGTASGRYSHYHAALYISPVIPCVNTQRGVIMTLTSTARQAVLPGTDRLRHGAGTVDTMTADTVRLSRDTTGSSL